MSRIENLRDRIEDRIEDSREWIRDHRDGLGLGGALILTLAAGGVGGVVGLRVKDAIFKPEKLTPEGAEEVFIANRPIEAKCKAINSIVSVDLRRNEHGEPKAAVVYCKPIEPTK
jgi:hypothetical protein